MSGIKYIANVLNQKGAPAIFEDTFANRPTAGYIGRIFISTDTFVIQRDNGTGWDSLGGGGGGITGTGAAGQVTFWTGASAVSGDNTLFWDNTNKRLGLGTVTPGVRLDIHGTNVLQQLNGTTTNSSYIDFQNAGATQWRVGNFYNVAAHQFSIFNSAFNPGLTILQTLDILFGSALTGATGLSIPASNNITYGESGGESYVNIFRQSTSAATIIANGYKRTATANGFASSTNANWAKSAIGLGVTAGGIQFYCDPAAITANGTDLTPTPRVTISSVGIVTMTTRANVNNATDNSLFSLNNNGNFYTVGFSPNFSTYTSNITISSGSNLNTGYVFKTAATITVNLPAVSGLNNMFYFVVLAGTTVTVNRAGSDNIINTVGTTVTSLTLVGYTKIMLYCDGGTTWYQLF